MVYIRTAEEIELLRRSSLLVGKTLAEVAKYLKPGVTTAYLDSIAESYIVANGAKPAFKGYSGFPKTLCISINEQVIHGIPSDTVMIKDGDIVSIDCGTFMNGYVGDSAFTFAVGNVKPEYLKLLEVTKQSLYLGIENAVTGKKIGDIGNAIQNYCESFGYSVVREYGGHGVGAKMHEDPHVPNYGKKDSGMTLKSGMVIAIEPMINLGKKWVKQEKDGWTVRTYDRLPSAHFEHDVAVQEGKADILSSFEPIEQAIQQNEYLN